MLLSDLPRAEIFISSKIWTSHRSYDGVMRAFTDIIEQLKTTYLDQLLIHWPATQGEPMIWQSQNAGTWRALEDLYEQGAVKVIGVSNFLPHHLVPLLARARIRPMVNQLEIHPGYPQLRPSTSCFKQNIAVQAWSPARPRRSHHTTRSSSNLVRSTASPRPHRPALEPAARLHTCRESTRCGTLKSISTPSASHSRTRT